MTPSSNPQKIILKGATLCFFLFLMSSFVAYRAGYLDSITTFTDDTEEYSFHSEDINFSPENDSLPPRKKKKKKKKLKHKNKNKNNTHMYSSKSGVISRPTTRPKTKISSSKSGAILTPTDVKADTNKPIIIAPSSKSAPVLRPTDIKPKKQQK